VQHKGERPNYLLGLNRELDLPDEADQLLTLVDGQQRWSSQLPETMRFARISRDEGPVTLPPNAPAAMQGDYTSRG